jgi:hypothetical protein
MEDRSNISKQRHLEILFDADVRTNELENMLHDLYYMPEELSKAQLIALIKVKMFTYEQYKRKVCGLSHETSAFLTTSSNSLS